MGKLDPGIIGGSAGELKEDSSGFLFVRQTQLAFYPGDYSDPPVMKSVLVAIPVFWFSESLVSGGGSGCGLLSGDEGNEPIDSVDEVRNI